MGELKQLRERFINSFSVLSENSREQIINHFNNMPAYLINEEFCFELEKLSEDIKKYLFHIENRGRKTGAKNKDTSDGQRVCNGPLCNGNKKKIEEFTYKTYCNECHLYKDKYGISKIFVHIDQHSVRRSKKKPTYLDVGEVSPYIRLEVFCKIWKQEYKCALSNDKLEDFTGLFKLERPKGLMVSPEKAKKHWSIDRINHRKGYTFDNIQIVTRKWNVLKGALEHGITSGNLDPNKDKAVLRLLFKQLEDIYL